MDHESEGIIVASKQMALTAWVNVSRETQHTRSRKVTLQGAQREECCVDDGEGRLRGKVANFAVP